MFYSINGEKVGFDFGWLYAWSKNLLSNIFWYTHTNLCLGILESIIVFGKGNGTCFSKSLKWRIIITKTLKDITSHKMLWYLSTWILYKCYGAIRSFEEAWNFDKDKKEIRILSARQDLLLVHHLFYALSVSSSKLT